jgi:hypothetical protein
MRLVRSVLLPLLALVAFALPSLAQTGPPGGTIYANDVAFSTVATPADLPPHGKFNTLYVLGGGLAPVSDAGPGDPGYRGGRWAVRMVTFSGAPRQLTNEAAVLAAQARGELSVGPVVRYFACPLIPK